MTAGFAFLQLSKKIRLKEIQDQNLENFLKTSNILHTLRESYSERAAYLLSYRFGDSVPLSHYCC